MTTTRSQALCEQLREARRARGWSVPFLARTARVSTHIITHIERRGVLPARFEPLMKLARALGVNEREAFEVWLGEVGGAHVGR